MPPRPRPRPRPLHPPGLLPRMEEEEYKRGYRKQFRSCDVGVEIVSGKVYSANHPVFAPSPGPPEEPQMRQQHHKQKEKKQARNMKWGGGLSDPEMKRRRRVATYKAYGVGGKLKASLRNGFRWVKFNCSKLVHSF